jgi:NAD(P)-dependent dehydrogenase (short-subunit alcohol dehydrogenase family)
MIDAVAPFFLINKFLPGMLANKWGRIINVSSAASLHEPGPINSAYGTAKVALNQLTRHLASELVGTGVTANVIHPGDVKTEMWGDIKNKVEAVGEAAANYKNWVDWVEQTGGDDPKKAVDLVLKLISTAGEQINGQFCWIDNPLQAPTKSW